MLAMAFHEFTCTALVAPSWERRFAELEAGALLSPRTLAPLVVAIAASRPPASVAVALADRALEAERFDAPNSVIVGAIGNGLIYSGSSTAISYRRVRRRRFPSPSCTPRSRTSTSPKASLTLPSEKREPRVGSCRRRSRTPTRAIGAPPPPWRSRHCAVPTRRGRWPRRSSPTHDAAAWLRPRGRRCERLGWSSAARTASKLSGTPSPYWSTPKGDSSTRARYSSWERRCAARGYGPRRATFFAPPSTKRRGLGASGLADRAHAELVAAGAWPRRDRRLLSGRESLTASEDRTAALAAEGLTNREIAQRQFVTVKAVEWHLRNVYRKLDISSRDELAGALTSVPST